MKYSRSTVATTAAALLAAASLTTADPAPACPNGNDDVCYRVGVPPSTASSGNGNIYFQIKAPTKYAWVALATGNGMVGSNMFVMYQDGSGNVTISPRTATGHIQPKEDTSSNAAKLTLLAGSGVEGDTMTANVACANCESWSGGSLNVKSTSTDWIGAWKAGSSLASKDKDADLRNMHDDTTSFKLDLSKASIASDSNPFVASGSGSGSDTGSGSGSGSGKGPGGNSGGGASDGDGAGPFGGGATFEKSKPNSQILVAHGIIMALVMAVFYPVGSALMPLIGKWFVHGAWQLIAFLLMWAGLALGVICARERKLLFNNHHTLLGVVVVSCLGIQPFLGLAHHRYFVRNQQRGLVSHLHIWWGRIFMLLGVVNGGLGLQLAHAGNSLVIAYSVIAAVFFVCYAASKGLGLMRRTRGGAAAAKASKESRGSSSPRESNSSRKPYVDSRRRGSPPEGTYA